MRQNHVNYNCRREQTGQGGSNFDEGSPYLSGSRGSCFTKVNRLRIGGKHKSLFTETPYLCCRPLPEELVYNPSKESIDSRYSVLLSLGMCGF